MVSLKEMYKSEESLISLSIDLKIWSIKATWDQNMILIQIICSIFLVQKIAFKLKSVRENCRILSIYYILNEWSRILKLFYFSQIF